MRSDIALPIDRGRFQGTWQILLFNWPYYLLAGLVCAIGGLSLLLLALPPLVHVVMIGGLGCVVFWLVGSLVASYYVYDRSKLYRWEWITALFPTRPNHWAHIHAGFDEASLALRRLFPETDSTILEIYDPAEMTEPSIERARRRRPASIPADLADLAALPLGDGVLDAVFLIFTAHEIRNPRSRRRFFDELHRVITAGGKILLVEHVRDFINFLAYGPGFLHFLSKHEWMRLAHGAGFSLDREMRITPFVRVFVLEKRG